MAVCYFFAVKNLPFVDIPAGHLVLMYALTVNKKHPLIGDIKEDLPCVTFIFV